MPGFPSLTAHLKNRFSLQAPFPNSTTRGFTTSASVTPGRWQIARCTTIHLVKRLFQLSEGLAPNGGRSARYWPIASLSCESASRNGCSRRTGLNGTAGSVGGTVTLWAAQVLTGDNGGSTITFAYRMLQCTASLTAMAIETTRLEARRVPTLHSSDEGRYAPSGWMCNPPVGLTSLWRRGPMENCWRTSRICNAWKVPVFVEGWWVEGWANHTDDTPPRGDRTPIMSGHELQRPA